MDYDKCESYRRRGDHVWGRNDDGDLRCSDCGLTIPKAKHPEYEVVCAGCGATVELKRAIKVPWFLFWLLVAWPVAIVYAYLSTPNNCPKCGATMVV